MDSLDKDVNNCLIFLIANQREWRPEIQIPQYGNKVHFPIKLIGVTASGEVVAPGHI